MAPSAGCIIEIAFPARDSPARFGRRARIPRPLRSLGVGSDEFMRLAEKEAICMGETQARPDITCEHRLHPMSVRQLAVALEFTAACRWSCATLPDSRIAYDFRSLFFVSLGDFNFIHVDTIVCGFLVKELLVNYVFMTFKFATLYYIFNF